MTHLEEQWIEESKQMLISEEESKKTLEELKKKDPKDVKWEIGIPQILPPGSDYLKAMQPDYEPPIETIVEHGEMVRCIRHYHENHGYEAADELAKFYSHVYCKRPGAPSVDFDFDEMRKAFKAYKASIVK